jgi:hypothetical protein
MKIAIITQVLNPNTSFFSWLKYHKHLADHIFVFFDRYDEINLPFIPKEKGIHYLPGSQVQIYDSPINNNMMRQNENIKKALEFCLEMNIDWLIHIDTDELLFGSREDLEKLFGNPTVGHVTFKNHEAVPIWASDNVFKECQYFKINSKFDSWDWSYSPWFFLAYDNGKSAARVTPELTATGPHRFEKTSGEHLTNFEEPFILHYPNTTYQSWLQKYENLGVFGDYWYDDPKHPNDIGFYMASRDVYQRCKKSGDFTEAENFFKRQILTQEQIDKMLQSGAIMKIGGA